MKKREITQLARLFLLLLLMAAWFSVDLPSFSVQIKESSYEKEKEESKEENLGYNYSKKKLNTGKDKNPDLGFINSSKNYYSSGFRLIETRIGFSFIFSQSKLYLLYQALKIHC